MSSISGPGTRGGGEASCDGDTWTSVSLSRPTGRPSVRARHPSSPVLGSASETRDLPDLPRNGRRRERSDRKLKVLWLIEHKMGEGWVSVCVLGYVCACVHVSVITTKNGRTGPSTVEKTEFEDDGGIKQLRMGGKLLVLSVVEKDLRKGPEGKRAIHYRECCSRCH